MLKDAIQNLPGELFRQILFSICNSYGADRVVTLKEAIFNFGLVEGEKLREQLATQGQKLDMVNFMQHNHFIDKYSVQIRRLIDGEIVEFSQPLSEGAEHQAQMALGMLLCEFHKGMLAGYNPTLSESYSGCIMVGSHSCQLVSKVNIH